jgi:hypothetical protein
MVKAGQPITSALSASGAAPKLRESIWIHTAISELTTDVNDYIEFYNHRRFHQTLEYKK